VDRRLAPLRQVLRNGQTVQVITAKGASPNPAWVNFVVTAKARTAIRHYLKNLRRGEAVDLGKRLLRQALLEFGVKLDDVPAAQLQAALQEFALTEKDDLFEKVGLGERLAPLVARRLLPEERHPGDEHGKSAALNIAGAEGLLVSYAHCCYPIPGDAIMAFLSAGRGIVIHREGCANVEDYNRHPENWLPVEWQQAAGRFFSSELRVQTTNRMGILAALSAAIAGTQTNISHVRVEAQDSETSDMAFVLEVHDRQHLARIVRILRRMADVQRVTRTIAGTQHKRERH
jgi:(p)ppGpp synthase/HD superfamily hydrolase